MGAIRGDHAPFMGLIKMVQPISALELELRMTLLHASHEDEGNLVLVHDAIHHRDCTTNTELFKAYQTAGFKRGC